VKVMIGKSLIRKLVDTLAKGEIELFKRYGLAHFRKAIVQVWNPYSTSDAEADKRFFLVKDAWIRLKEDGEVTLESFKRSSHVPKETALQYSRELKIPIFHLQKTDIYETKIEYKLAEEKPIEIPEELEVDGVIVKYGEPLIEKLVYEAVKKWGEGEASRTAIIEYLTSLTYGGWIQRTPEKIKEIEEAIENLKNKGFLKYDEERETYIISPIPTPAGTSPLE